MTCSNVLEKHCVRILHVWVSGIASGVQKCWVGKASLLSVRRIRYRIWDRLWRAARWSSCFLVGYVWHVSWISREDVLNESEKPWHSGWCLQPCMQQPPMCLDCMAWQDVDRIDCPLGLRFRGPQCHWVQRSSAWGRSLLLLRLAGLMVK